MPIDLVLQPHTKDLGGGFIVRRLLPAAQRQGVGPFLFFDHFGPVTVQPADNFDVRPHPHIGLATVSYLFDGAMVHRDSLGRVQRIEPGAINWMTAGRGIVHSERRPDDLREQSYPLHGLQLWAALPQAAEETEPAFAHTPAAQIPQVDLPGATVQVLIGEAFAARSPVQTFSPTLYLDIALQPDATLTLAAADAERAVYSVDRALRIDGVPVEPRTLALLAPGAAAEVMAPQGARCVVIGGAPLDGHRFLNWNFVSSRKERIAQAREDWAAQRMGSVPGEADWIPLP